jgi:hypothetical protein
MRASEKRSPRPLLRQFQTIKMLQIVQVTVVGLYTIVPKGINEGWNSFIKRSS